LNWGREKYEWERKERDGGRKWEKKLVEETVVKF